MQMLMYLCKSFFDGKKIDTFFCLIATGHLSSDFATVTQMWEGLLLFGELSTLGLTSLPACDTPESSVGGLGTFGASLLRGPSASVCLGLCGSSPSRAQPGHQTASLVVSFPRKATLVTFPDFSSLYY